MKRISESLLLILLLLSGATAAEAEASSRIPGCAYFETAFYDTEKDHFYNRDYVALICSGLAKQEVGLLESAAEDYEAAAATLLHEMPNYFPYPLLAHVALLRGRYREYDQHLYRAEVAFSLLHGDFSCNETPEGWGAVLDHEGKALENAAAEQVAENVCSSFFIPYLSPDSISLEEVVIHAKFVDYFLYVRGLRTQREMLSEE